MLSIVRNLRTHRHLLSHFIRRDLKVKYRGTLFGYLWSLLEPLSLVAVYYLLFAVIAQRGEPGFPLIVAVGVLTYNFIPATILAGSNALVSNASLIKRIYIPREIFVLSAAGTQLVVYLLNLLTLIPLMFIYGIMPGVALLWLPVALALLIAFSLGIALFSACANAVYRDIAYLVRVATRLMFYATPAIYPVSMVPEKVRDYYLYDPVAVYLSMTRSAVMGREFPFHATHLAVAVAAALFSLLFGAWFFTRNQAKAVKFL